MRNYNVIFKRNILTRQWRWKIVATNGKVIGASSEGFWNKKDCEDNAKNVGSSLHNHLN